MEISVKTTQVQLRPYCLKELAALYEVKPRTIKIWLQPFTTAIGTRNGRYYTIKQIEIIFDKIGEPKKMVAA